MISSRLRNEVRDALGVLVLCCIVGGACDLHSSSRNETSESSSSLIAVGQEGESGRSVLTYYGQMWFRTWQAPLIIVLTGTAALTMMLFSFGSSGIQAAGDYYKSGQLHDQQQQPVVIDGYVESYGDPPHHSFWG
ncbi:uncharacterized protein LOC135708191 [Ochlerotatus camptorhynchus]|uniref:uncharacterized protein LOC135708191 n=1 Tax=Ochlerotatus camptorhynchus TaxID=644619 RepID=UPI0031E23A18